MLGRERRDVLRDLLHHQRIGLRRDVPAAEMLGQRDDAERDRHPCLDARRGVWLVRIALDPDQFGRAAADVEQDGAPPLRIEQRRAADHGERRLGLAVDHLEPDAGLGGDPVPKAVGVRGRAAGFGRDQPQALGLLGLDLVAADAQRGDGAFDRGLADAAGRRDALAEPDDPRERIDHAKAVAGRTGDQQAAIVGAEVERRIDAGSGGRAVEPAGASACRADRCSRDAASGRRLRAARGRREAACHRSSKMSFRGRQRADEEFPFTETLAAPRRRCNSRSHRTMPNQALSFGYRLRYLQWKPRKSRKNRHFRDLSMQDHTSSAVPGKRYRTAKIRCRAAGPPQGRRHAGARQGQIHRRFQPARPGLCLDRALQPRPRHHPRHRHRGRQGHAGRARRLDRRRPCRRPITAPSPAACR